MFIEVLVVLRGCQAKHTARFRGLGGFACGRVFAVGRNMGGCVCVSEAFAARVLRCSL